MARPKQGDYYLRAARKLGIKVEKVPGTSYFKLSSGNSYLLLNEGYTSRMSVLAHIASSEKHIAKAHFRNAGLSTTNWVEFYEHSTAEDIRQHCKKLTFPLVVKPARGSHGNFVSVDIKSMDKVVADVQRAQKSSWTVLVEEMFEGVEMRLLATRNQFLAATMRRPASVVGDGKLTIAQLVERKNKDPRRSRPDTVLHKLKINAKARATLKEQGYTPGAVPPNDARVFLRKISNIAGGGDSIDVTDDIHLSIKRLAVKTVRSISNLPFAGLDFMTKDYTVKQVPGEYNIIEINDRPMINSHYRPYEGKSRDVAKDILLELFPNLTQ